MLNLNQYFLGDGNLSFVNTAVRKGFILAVEDWNGNALSLNVIFVPTILPKQKKVWDFLTIYYITLTNYYYTLPLSSGQYLSFKSLSSAKVKVFVTPKMKLSQCRDKFNVMSQMKHIKHSSHSQLSSYSFLKLSVLIQKSAFYIVIVSCLNNNCYLSETVLTKIQHGSTFSVLAKIASSFDNVPHPPIKNYSHQYFI